MWTVKRRQVIHFFLYTLSKTIMSRSNSVFAKKHLQGVLQLLQFTKVCYFEVLQRQATYTYLESVYFPQYGVLDNQWVNVPNFLQVRARNSAGTGSWSALITLGRLTSNGTFLNLIFEPY